MDYYRGKIVRHGGGYELEIWKEDPLWILAIPLGIFLTGLMLLVFVQYLLPFLVVPIVIFILSKRAKTYGKGAMLLSVSSFVGTLMVSLVFIIAVIPGMQGFRNWVDQRITNSDLAFLAVIFSWLICLAMGILSLSRAIQYKKRAIAVGEDPKKSKNAVTVSILNLVYWAFGIQALTSVFAFLATGSIN